MNIMFWVTEKCNLNCDYCYVRKKPKTMPLETAEEAFYYFKKEFPESRFREKEVHIGFHGGEPLLNFPVIRYLTEKFEQEYGTKIRYFSLTTNGTVFEEEMFAYLMKHISLSVSIDGKRQTNDSRRHYGDGSSCFGDAIRTLEYLKAHKTFCRVRMTVDRQTMDTFAENYIFLDKKDYGVVTYAIDTGDEWSGEDMENYSRQMEKIMDYFAAEKPEDGKYFLYNLKEGTFRPRSYCDGGITNFHVSPEGGLYPCIMSMDDPEFLLGSVKSGIDKQALQNLQEVNERPVEGCEECGFQNHCASQVCKIINKKATGSCYRPPAVSCMERAVIYGVYKKYESLMEGFHA